MVTERNNMHDIDTWIFFKWVFKSFLITVVMYGRMIEIYLNSSCAVCDLSGCLGCFQALHRKNTRFTEVNLRSLSNFRGSLHLQGIS